MADENCKFNKILTRFRDPRSTGLRPAAFCSFIHAETRETINEEPL
jgi:hypothetical protein